MSDYTIYLEIKNPKLISINEQYIHPVKKYKTKNGKYRYHSYFAPSSYLKEVKSFYEEKLKEIDEKSIEFLKSVVSKSSFIGLRLDIEIGMPLKDIYESDVSNYIKALEDCVSKRIGIDDSNNFEVRSRKSLYETEDNSWILRIKLSTCRLINYFQEDL